jgi:peptidoglycan/xylan/chitin deacetylase (PgdA/CDA1 family)
MLKWKSNNSLLFGYIFLFQGVALIAQNSDNQIPDKFYEQENKFPDFLIIRGNDSLKLIALTFDDGPSEISNKVMDILDRHNCTATFFWLGTNISGHRDIVERAIANGYEIGNHSWDHPHLGEYTPERLWEEQVGRTEKEFKDLTGKNMRFYRPPFGSISDKQIDFLKKKNIRTILWTVSSVDWDKSRNSSNQIENRIFRNLNPGTIVLLHDFDPLINPDAGPDRAGMLIALENIIIKGNMLGYEFVTIQQLIDSQLELKRE